ncbi:anti-sigma regulatory factor [Roseateles sp. L2-2]|uniref:anti-sigma regulatory factor n=1 Tax=Roseateles sp. L2-2 TaxID=3422597 RepID=UPI003D362B2A
MNAFTPSPAAGTPGASSSSSTSGSLPIRSEPDIVLSRQLVRKLTQELKFSLVDQTKMITAASELSRNTLVYGGGGAMEWAIVQSGVRSGLRLAFVDEGPGIPDLELAMKDGWTSGSGMGMGLSGSKRLVNDFELESAPGRGTRVTITRWK